MEIVEKGRSFESPLPRAYEFTRALEGRQTFEGIHGTRHPAAAYNASLILVARRIVAVVRELTLAESQLNYYVSALNFAAPELVEATDHMLDALMEHFDVCAAVIKSCFKDKDDRVAKECLKTFLNSVRGYRSHVGEIDNYLKHFNGSLRAVAGMWPGHVCSGYFVEGPIVAKSLGPVPKIHDRKSQAFSFNRDLPYHLCSIHAIGARLAFALRKHVSVTPEGKPHHEAVARQWREAVLAVGELPAVYFPDEITRPRPSVKVHASTFDIEMPCHRRAACAEMRRVLVTYEPDGFTQIYKVPYMHPAAKMTVTESR